MPGDLKAAPTEAEIIEAWWTASASLVQWPRRLGKGEGREIPRPEYEQVLQLVRQPSPSLVCLLGRPGTGKSALMARLCDDLRKEGWAVLGIKADKLKADVSTPEELVASLGIDELTTSLAALAPKTRALVVFDQVDALASLLDQHTQRLDAVLATIHQLRHSNRVAVVLSSREVDYAYDPQLTVLKREAVHLRPLTEADVRASLSADGIDVSGWSPADARFEMLGAPYYLRIFTEIYGRAGAGHPPATMREFDLIRELWNLHVRPVDQGSALAKSLANEIGEREELWVPLAPFEDQVGLRPLLSAGVLVQEGERLGFMHQHFFEYVWARSRPLGSLANFVLERNGLMVRPRLWAGLQYERSIDQSAYLNTLDALLDRDAFDHLSQLTLSFVGQVEDWLDHEYALLDRHLDRFSHAVLGAMSANPANFQRIRPRLRSLLAEGNRSAWEYLERCAARSPKEVVELAATSPKWRGGRVLQGLAHWIPEAALLAEVSIDAATDGYGVVQVLGDVGRLNPEEAARLMGRKLEAMWRAAVAQDEAATEEAEVRFYRESKRARVFVPDWYGLDKLVGQAPRAFAPALWEFFERHVRELPPGISLPGAYPRDALSGGLDPGLTGMLANALREWAKADGHGFLTFLQERADRPANAFHRLQALLASALAEIAAENPRPAAEFLLGDDRRLQLGLESDLLHWSALLVETAARADEGVARQLAARILAWLPPAPHEPLEPEDWYIKYWGAQANRRLRQHELHRRLQARYQLLRALPAQLRASDPHLAPRFRDLHGRFEAREDLYLMKMGDGLSSLRPPPAMSPRGMRAAGPAAVRKHLDAAARAGEHHLFEPDYEAVITNSTRQDPAFGVALLPTLHTGEADRIGAVLDGLPPDELEAAVLALDAAGQVTSSVQYRCAHALYAVADQRGLSDAVVDLLERWLLAGDPEPIDEGSESADSHEESKEADQDRRPSPVLLSGGAWFSSGGPSQLAWLAFRGLAKRGSSAQPRLSSKLLLWIDHPAIGWSCWDKVLNLGEGLGWVLGPQREEAASRLRARFARQLASLSGAMAAFRNYRWLPRPERAAWLDLLATSPNRKARQALGELLGLLGEENEPAHWSRVLSEPDATAERTGLAFVCLDQWKNAPDRLALTRTLVKILEIDGAKASWLLNDFFLRARKELSSAPETADLVRLLVARPELMPRRGIDLHALKTLVVVMPDEVSILVERLLDLREAYLDRNAATQLVYALCRHRRPATRARGLALFNRLVNEPSMQALVRTIDASRSDYPTA